jgi:UDP-N-acetylmuramate dehydrogenase
MKIQENFSLKNYNTFGINKNARYFCEVESENEILACIDYSQKIGLPIFILGGGSNILLLNDLDYLVIKINIKGIEVIEESDEYVTLKVGAGENWHEFVSYCIDQNYSGIENLALIPGTVGASPMQNIGAYGIELQSVFHELTAINRQTKSTKKFNWEDCKFGYRESVFKNELKNQFIISHVSFKLGKVPNYNIEYGAIKTILEESGVKELSLRAVSDAVIQIRRSKLPDPKVIGNAGSFFKNPTIDASHFEKLKLIFPDIPGYKVEENVKIPAAWLIEKAGWKGYREGNTGVHVTQPLVLVNFGESNGQEILQLSHKIQSSIKDKFGISLNPEVNFIK